MSGKRATEVLASDDSGVIRACEILKAGGLVAVPTETVYGLAARGDDGDAVARIYAAKGRPAFNPLIAHVRDIDAAGKLVEIGPDAEEMAERYWPGPLTLVLPRRADAGLADAVSAGLPTLAIRVPAHPVMQAILAKVAFPLVAPSANRSGLVSPTSAAHVLASLDGRIDAVIDGGDCAQGLESTILAWRGAGKWDELRPGPISLPEKLRRATSDSFGIEAPGQLASHYSPGKPVRLNAEAAGDDEFFIGFGSVAGDCSLSLSGDLEEAAMRLYGCLHLAAQSDRAAVGVAAIPNVGIGKAINDRLRRAAS